MTLITLSPATGTDDGYFQLSGSLYSSSASTYSFFSNYGNWYRMPSVAIPPGSTINSATLSVYLASGSGTNHTHNWYANDADNATYPATAAAAQALTLTSATVQQSITASGFPKTHQVTGLAAIVQEVIDRPGWAENNALMLISRYWAGSSGIVMNAYESGSNIWSIAVDFTPPSGAGGTLLLLGC